jgi:uncharacterized membrane protein YukC
MIQIFYFALNSFDETMKLCGLGLLIIIVLLYFYVSFFILIEQQQEEKTNFNKSQILFIFN